MKTTYTTPSHVNLFITRPNGDKETVKHPKFTTINDNMFSQMVVATKKAGRGDITGYENVRKTHQIPQSELDNRKKAKEFNDTYNEGCTDSYNPYYG